MTYILIGILTVLLQIVGETVQVINRVVSVNVAISRLGGGPGMGTWDGASVKFITQKND